MGKFAYNNVKNASNNHIQFQLNCGYYLRVFFKKDTNSCSCSKIADKLAAKLQKLLAACCENLHHAEKLQKQAYNKGVMPENYAFNNKIWLNSKYINTKYNQIKSKYIKTKQN